MPPDAHRTLRFWANEAGAMPVVHWREARQRIENPCVGGSNPLLPIPSRAPVGSGSGASFFFASIAQTTCPNVGTQECVDGERDENP